MNLSNLPFQLLTSIQRTPFFCRKDVLKKCKMRTWKLRPEFVLAWGVIASTLVVLFLWSNCRLVHRERGVITRRLSLMERVGDIPVLVSRPPVCRSERVNIVYVKTHKCGTSSVFLFILWFGLRRNLSFVLPRLPQYTLCYPYPFDTRCFLPSKKPFNIMGHHVVFNDDAISRVMPRDAVYITSIRHPFDRMKSAFNYYSVRERLSMLTHVDEPLLEYLRDIPKYEAMYAMPAPKNYNRKCMGSFSFTHNTMAFELGLPTGFHVNTTDQTNNATYIRRWIDALQRRFSLVIILEYYTESVVLLRRLMCWKLNDILSVKQNERSYAYKAEQVEQTLVDNYKRYNEPEYILYDHFNKTLWQRIAEEPDDFWDELSTYRALLRDVGKFCATSKPNDVLSFQASRWNEEFVVTNAWCSKFRIERGVYKAHQQKRVEVVENSAFGPGC